MSDATTVTSKPWWASKTIWTNIVAGAASIAASFGFDLGGDLVAGITTGILAVVNIILRLVTKEPVAR